MYYATHGDAARAEPLLRKAASQPGATAQERQNLALVLGLEGRFDEAEKLQRQDLPPDEVDNNLAYLRADGRPAARPLLGLAQDAAVALGAASISTQTARSVSSLGTDRRGLRIGKLDRFAHRRTRGARRHDCARDEAASSPAAA